MEYSKFEGMDARHAPPKDNFGNDMYWVNGEWVSSVSCKWCQDTGMYLVATGEWVGCEYCDVDLEDDNATASGRSN